MRRLSAKNLSLAQRLIESGLAKTIKQKDKILIFGNIRIPRAFPWTLLFFKIVI